MDAPHQVNRLQSPGAVLAFAVALAGLCLVLLSATIGQVAADTAVRVAGGSLELTRYELVMQLNADAARIAGAVLLGVGAFVALRRI